MRSHAKILAEDEEGDIDVDDGCKFVDVAGKLYFRSVESASRVMMQVGGMSLDDDVEREHEESAEMRSSSTLALSSFKGS